jgi:uncharacterized protein (TIGR00251 family)
VADSARIRLRVSPRARRTALVGRHGDVWKLRVSAPPEAGRANEEALGAVADAVAVPRASVALVAGRSSRDKIVEVAGLREAEVERRLARSLTSEHPR